MFWKSWRFLASSLMAMVAITGCGGSTPLTPTASDVSTPIAPYATVSLIASLPTASSARSGMPAPPTIPPTTLPPTATAPLATTYMGRLTEANGRRLRQQFLNDVARVGSYMEYPNWEDPTWQRGMEAALAQMAQTHDALYALLNPVADHIQWNYFSAFSGDCNSFIKGYLSVIKNINTLKARYPADWGANTFLGQDWYQSWQSIVYMGSEIVLGVKFPVSLVELPNQGFDGYRAYMSDIRSQRERLAFQAEIVNASSLIDSSIINY